MSDRDPSRAFEAHPDDAVTASYLEGSLDEDAREWVEAHLAECAGCRAGVALLALDRPPGGAQVKAGELAPFREAALSGTRPTRTRRAPRWLMAAAAVLVAATGVAFWLASRAPGDTTLLERDADPGALRAIAPQAGSVVGASELSFRFTPVAGADRYLVTVLDGTGRSLAAIETRAPGGPVAWPEGQPVPRGTLLWSVRAMNLGRTIAETRPVAFECR